MIATDSNDRDALPEGADLCALCGRTFVVLRETWPRAHYHSLDIDVRNEDSARSPKEFAHIRETKYKDGYAIPCLADVAVRITPGGGIPYSVTEAALRASARRHSRQRLRHILPANHRPCPARGLAQSTKSPNFRPTVTASDLSARNTMPRFVSVSRTRRPRKRPPSSSRAIC